MVLNNIPASCGPQGKVRLYVEAVREFHVCLTLGKTGLLAFLPGCCRFLNTDIRCLVFLGFPFACCLK